MELEFREMEEGLHSVSSHPEFYRAQSVSRTSLEHSPDLLLNTEGVFPIYNPTDISVSNFEADLAELIRLNPLPDDFFKFSFVVTQLNLNGSVTKSYSEDLPAERVSVRIQSSNSNRVNVPTIPSHQESMDELTNTFAGLSITLPEIPVAQNRRNFML